MSVSVTDFISPRQISQARERQGRGEALSLSCWAMCRVNGQLVKRRSKAVALESYRLSVIAVGRGGAEHPLIVLPDLRLLPVVKSLAGILERELCLVCTFRGEWSG